MHAIPTLWRGVQFRSRLEARWAAFFTRIGWPWEYEPVDLKGYIPDFILKLQNPVLVEVKPFMTVDDPVVEEAYEKILNSGWVKLNSDGSYQAPWDGSRDTLIVGATLFESACCDGGISVGLLEASDPPHHATIGVCDGCGKVSFCSDVMDYSCRVCGYHDGSQVGSGRKSNHVVMTAWAWAGNQVQWKPARR